MTSGIVTKAEEDRRPVLVAVAPAEGPGRPALFIGNAPAALDGALLARHGITASLNCAVNLEIPPLTLADGTVTRRAHVGLVDGAGNRPHHLLSAVLAVEGMIGQLCPGKPSYPAHRSGNLLVHCRGGRSRSATVLGVYLALARPDRFPDLKTALAAIRAARGLGPEQPRGEMLALARAVLAWPGVAAMFAAG